MPALDTALPFEQVNHIAVRIAEYLDLNVTRGTDVSFDEYSSVTEGGSRFADRQAHLLFELSGCMYDAHTFSTTARGCLNQHRKPDLLGYPHTLFYRFKRLGRAGYQGNIVRFGGRLRGQFAAHLTHGIAARSDEDDTGSFHQIRERRVLRQEPITRMDGIGAGLTGSLDDALHDQITLAGSSRSNANCFVGIAHVQGIPIGFRKHRNGSDTHFTGRAHDPDRDLAPVGDQYLLHNRLLAFERYGIR